jgi:hypothetical protein
MYLEDDMFLNAPLRFGEGNYKYIASDGRIVSYLTNKWIMSHPQPSNGWTGAMWSSLKALEKMFGPRNQKSYSLVEGMGDVLIGNRASESEHGPRFWNKCAMEELWRLWPKEYAATVNRKINDRKDFQTISHLGMFMEDLGLGKNIAESGIMCHEVHTNSNADYKKSDFVKGICKAWLGKDKMKKPDWLQVQGDGISDEYIFGEHRARGDLRWAWQAIQEEMWPKQSSFENSPFVDKGITMKLRRYGNTLCKRYK